MALQSEHEEPVPRPVGAISPANRGDLIAQAPTGGGGGRDLEPIVSALRARVEEELKLSERLDQKGRQAFLLSLGFFTAVQAVTFGSFAVIGVTAHERRWLVGLAIVASLALVLVGLALRHAEALRKEDDIKPSKLVEWADESRGDPEYVLSRLVSER